MKMFLVPLLIFSLNSIAGEEVSSNPDCKDGKCTYKDCHAKVVVQIDSSNMASCKEVYRDGVLLYKEVKVLSQHVDEETKKHLMTGVTLQVK